MHKNTDEEMAALYLGRAAGKEYLFKFKNVDEWAKSNDEYEFSINLKYKEVKQPRVLYLAVDYNGRIDFTTMCSEKESILLTLQKCMRFEGFVKMVEEVENDDD